MGKSRAEGSTSEKAPLNELEVEFREDAIQLRDYPFLRRNRGRVLPARDISEVLLDWAPPAVRTWEGEFIFISATQQDELREFATRCRLPLVDRVDVWDLLLEPFLDTELSQAEKEDTLQKLAENGVPEGEANKIRALVKNRMGILVFVTWEWAHFGLYDVLNQMKFLTWTTGWTFGRFYDYAMEIANRGAAREKDRPRKKPASRRPDQDPERGA